jgi:hypothetical protein
MRQISVISCPQFALLAASIGFVVALEGACGGGSPTAPTTAGPVQDPATATSLTFTQDVQSILNNDCVTCHGGSSAGAGYDVRTYAGVMRAVTAGSASSPLVQITQPGGRMYGQFRGSASAKAETIRRWVVDFRGVQ